MLQNKVHDVATDTSSMKMRWTTHSFRRNFQRYYINLQTVYTNTNSDSCKAGCQIWPILGKEFRKAVRASLKEAVLLSFQKHIYYNNFVNIVKLFKNVIKYMQAYSNYLATLRMINYSALPAPPFTADLLVTNCVQLPRPYHFTGSKITSDNKWYFHLQLISAAGTVIFNWPGCPQNTHISAAIILWFIYSHCICTKSFPLSIRKTYYCSKSYIFLH